MAMKTRGFRHNTFDCKSKEKKMETRKLSVDQISKTENSRTKIKDVSGLMESIRNNGLLQPIGVCEDKNGKFKIVFGNRRLEAVKKLGMKEIDVVVLDKQNDKDFILKNLVENIQREDISYAEIGRLCDKLKNDFEMTESEIAVYLGVPVKRVSGSINVIKSRVPEKYLKKIKTLNAGEKRRGAIPAHIATKILNISKKYSLTKKEVGDLFRAVDKDESIIGTKIDVLSVLLSKGYTIKESFKLAEKIRVIRPTIVMYEADYKKAIKNEPLKDFIDRLIFSTKKIKKPKL